MSQILRSAIAIVLMTRPTHLLLIAVVYLFGSTIALAAGHAFDRSAVPPALLVLLLVSASIHMANEYADYETDRLTRRTLFSGGSGAFEISDLPRVTALQGAWVFLAAGLLGALMWAEQLGGAAVGVLITGAVTGWMYSMPPLKLAWRGWGELDNAFAGGILLPLYGYAVQAKAVETAGILGALPFAILVFLNLLATTWMDRRADRSVGKLTLATRWPTIRLRQLYWLGAAAALASLLLMEYPWIVKAAGVVPLMLVGVGGWFYTRREAPLPAVAGMVLMAVFQLFAWWSRVSFCCWFG